MNLEQIRKLIIIAICSNSDLLNLLVLKGGNALSLIHKIGLRTSVDIDFSMAGDFESMVEAQDLLFRVLEYHFNSHGYVLFDRKFERKPSKNLIDPEWGGYRAEFKLIKNYKYKNLSGNLQAIRRQALDIDTIGSSRKFKIDISRYEYTEGKEEAEIDNNICYVYTAHHIVFCFRVGIWCGSMRRHSMPSVITNTAHINILAGPARP
jgi:hypothetical protein